MHKSEVKLISQFRDAHASYEALESRALEIINKIIDDNNFFVMEVTHRVKDVDSMITKLKRKSGKYGDLTDMTDLCGFRVICYFSDTVDEFASKVEEFFVIDRDNTVDKRATLAATQFGYLSLHYVCYLKGNDDVCKIPFEIQIRTVLQHCWAEIEHDLGYKSAFGIPRTIRREFSRIAGLLEIADNQFLALRDNTAKYTRDIKEKIRSGNASDILLDIFSLSEFIRENHEFNEFANNISKSTNAEVEYIDPEAYMPQLEWFGLTTVGDFLDMISRNEVSAYHMIIDKITELELDILSTNMILRYICRAELIRGRYSRDKIISFLSLSSSHNSVIEVEADKIVEQIKQLEQ